jgi:hypothetical protein
VARAQIHQGYRYKARPVRQATTDRQVTTATRLSTRPMMAAWADKEQIQLLDWRFRGAAEAVAAGEVAVAEAAGREVRAAAVAEVVGAHRRSGLPADFPVVGVFHFVVEMAAPADQAEPAATAAKVVREVREAVEAVAEAQLRFSREGPSRSTPRANSLPSAVKERAGSLARPDRTVDQEAMDLTNWGDQDFRGRHTSPAMEELVAVAATEAAVEMAAVVTGAATAVTADTAPGGRSSSLLLTLSEMDLPSTRMAALSPVAAASSWEATWSCRRRTSSPMF